MKSNLDQQKSSRSIRSRIVAALQTVRPMVQADGGDVELVDVDDQGQVHVRLLGACIGCPSRSLTLQHGIEASIKSQVPEVSRVICD